MAMCHTHNTIGTVARCVSYTLALQPRLAQLLTGAINRKLRIEGREMSYINVVAN